MTTHQTLPLAYSSSRKQRPSATTTPWALASSAEEDHAGAVSGERGRCFRFVTDPDGKPVNCPERSIASGWLKVGDRCHEVDALRSALDPASQPWLDISSSTPRRG